MDLNEQSPRIDQPPSISLPLYTHQRTAIAAMTNLEQTHTLQFKAPTGYLSDPQPIQVETGFGILGDRVGAGKTLEVSALIASYPPPTPWCTYLSNSNNYVKSKVIHHDSATSNLIIVPPALTKQWRETLELAGLQTYIFNSSRSIRDFIAKPCQLSDYQVILLSSTFQRAFYEQITPPKRWNRVILDEVTYSIYKKLHLDCNFMWLVTATPFSHSVHRGFFTSRLMEGLSYTFLRHFVVRNTDAFVDKSISLPDMVRHTIICQMPTELTLAGEALPEAVRDLIHAGCMEDAVRSLNCNVHTEASLMKVLTENLDKQLKNAKAKETYLKQLTISEEDRKTRLKRVYDTMTILQNKIDGIRNRVAQEKSCPICISDVEHPLVTPCCHHIMCGGCILQALSHSNSKCPMCRTIICAKDLTSVQEEVPNLTLAQEPTEVIPTKSDALRAWCKTLSSDQRVLIASRYSNSFQELSETLLELKIPFAILQGTGVHIQKLIESYHDGKIPILLLNAQYMGSGLNLETTTDIILYHRLPEGMEQQVIGRAQRPGRTSPLHVHELLYSGETASTHVEEEHPYTYTT